MLREGIQLRGNLASFDGIMVWASNFAPVNLSFIKKAVSFFTEAFVGGGDIQADLFDGFFVKLDFIVDFFHVFLELGNLFFNMCFLRPEHIQAVLQS